MTLAKSLITATIATAALSVLPAMAAGKNAITQSSEVNLAGYDLSEVKDAKAAIRKIEQAAEKVCSIPGGDDSLRERMEKRDCEAEAIENAVKDLDSSIVTALVENGSAF